MSAPLRQIRAQYDDDSITVYQAYSPAIADAAVQAGRFVEPFKLSRMTWIKPSFYWMMYRCGWATKPGQERVLAIRMTRDGFEAALSQSCLSHFDAELHADHDAWLNLKSRSPARIQWDPERDAALNPLPHRSLQVGLGGSTVRDYVREWTLEIRDITEQARSAQLGTHPGFVLDERPYPLPDVLAQHIGATG